MHCQPLKKRLICSSALQVASDSVPYILSPTPHVIWFRMHSVSKFDNKGHFTHKPRAMTMRLWEPKWKCPKAVATHLQHHVVWSWTLNCSVKSYVTGPSTKCYFNDFWFMRVLTHDKIKWINGCEHSECHGLLVFLLDLPPRGGSWK
jgi:hypothetical protein